MACLSDLESSGKRELRGPRDSLIRPLRVKKRRLSSPLSRKPEQPEQHIILKLESAHLYSMKQKEIPVHHMLEKYLAVANLPDDPKQPLFTSTRGRSRKLGVDPLSRKDA
jgi:hypothetical protein